jgi:hypothetical protein
MSVDTSLFGAMQAAREGAAAQRRNAMYASKDAVSFSVPGPSTPDPAPSPTAEKSSEEKYWDWRQTQDEVETRNARNSLIQQITGIFAEYGLSSLYDTIVGFVQQGYSADAIAILLRQTPQYKERFPAMASLSAKGRAISEAEYIAFESKAASLERAYGLPMGMLGKDAITTLISNEVSGQELEDRVVMAAAGAFQTSQEVKDTFAQYYGIGSGGLTAYFLDPEKALPLLERQYVSSQIGAEAAMQDVTVQAMTAERLFEQGISREEARQGFGQVASMGALTQGRGDVVTQEQLISGTFEQNTDAQRAIERAQRARTGRFQEGGGFATSQQGVSGLGSAATR